MLDGKIKIKVVDKKGLSKSQDLFLNLYYWASYCSNYKIVNMYLIDLGISPFIKSFKDMTPAHAAVLNWENINLFLYFVKNSRHGMPPAHDNVNIEQNWKKADRVNNKYECASESDWKIFARSRQNRDEMGNTIMHFLYSLPRHEVELRNEYLNVCIEEQIGSLSIRNFSNYLPH